MPIDFKPDAADSIPSALDFKADEVPPEPAYRNRTFAEDLKRNLGRTVGVAERGVTGTALAGGDALNTIINMAGKPFGMKPLQLPSKMNDKFLEQIGVPKDENTWDKVTSFLGSSVAGAGDPLLRGIQALVNSRFATPNGFGAPEMNANQRTTKELHDAGFKLTPEQMEGGTGTTTLYGLGDKSRGNMLLQEGNKSVAQGKAANATGLPANNLTDEVINAANNRLYTEGYGPVEALGNIPRGGRLFNQELNNAISVHRGPHADELTRRAAELRSRALTPQEALEQIRSLRTDATGAFRSNERTYGNALRDMADAIENHIERQLPPGSPVLDGYKAARTAIAKNNAVRDMLVDKSTGIIDPTKAHAMSQEGVKLTDGLDTIAKAGSPMYEAATKPPVHGAGTPVDWGSRLGGGVGVGIGGGVGYGLSGGSPWWTLAGLAAPPVMRAGARHLMASNVVQNAMANNLGPQPNLYGPAMQRMLPAGFELAPSLFGGQ